MTEQALPQNALLMTETNEDALEAAVREHARLVYRIAYSVSRNHHDAEDATQETFLRVLRYRGNSKGLMIPRPGSRGSHGEWRTETTDSHGILTLASPRASAPHLWKMAASEPL